MIQFYATLMTVLAGGREELTSRFAELRENRERGSLTVEQAIVTGLLVVAALALMVIIANAVTSRSASIQ
ncbi:hypothetical protein [Modestobacter marinus]|nr:hypothetical protein [Modestobacter marinus]NIH70240.1 hypothetical protein [Modestobacter marinus]